MGGPGPDKDVHISLEDQQKINKFARHNQRLEDIKDDMKSKESELVTLGDASNDVEEFSLTADEGEKIPYMVGEILPSNARGIGSGLVSVSVGGSHQVWSELRHSFIDARCR